MSNDSATVTLLTWLFFLGALLITSPGLAQENTPELTIGARGIASFAGTLTTAPGQTEQLSGLIDFSDTSLLVRGRYELFNGLRGGTLIGFQFPDADSDLGIIFFHQINVFLTSRWFKIKIGRSRTQANIVDFPTLRDDDMLVYTSVLNPFSAGKNTQDHQFANAFEATGIVASRYFFSIHAEHMIQNSDTVGTTNFLLNSVGASLSYQEIPGLVKSKVLKKLGIGANLYFIDQAQQAVIWNLLAGAALNLIPDPIHQLELRLQGIYSHGVAGLALTNINSSYRQQSLSISASLRYQWMKNMFPTLQVSIIGGYRRFLENTDGADSWSIVANTFYRLGFGFDVGLQYQVESNHQSLQTNLSLPAMTHKLQAAFVFEFERAFGKLPERRSILNTEHRYTNQ